MTNKHDERVEDEKYTSHEAIKEWEQEKALNNLTQNIVALLGIHGMHCMFYTYQDASHITKAFEGLFHTHTKEVREQTIAEVREKYKLIPKQSKRDKAKDDAWNDLGNTLRRGV